MKPIHLIILASVLIGLGSGIGYLGYWFQQGTRIEWIDQGKIMGFTISYDHACKLDADFEPSDICIQVATSTHGLVWAKSFGLEKIGTVVYVSQDGFGIICESNQFGEQVYC